MQFDNKRDPNSESIWLKNDNNYNVQVPTDSCYSNLSQYGTHFGPNTVVGSYANPALGGGLVKKIQVPYPVEPIPDIMQKLGQPHEFNSGYNLHKLENKLGCIGKNCTNEVKNMAKDSLHCLLNCENNPKILECTEECVMKDPALKPLINCVKNNCFMNNNNCNFNYPTLNQTYNC